MPLSGKFSSFTDGSIGFAFNVSCVQNLSQTTFEKKPISIYPNPANEHITIDFGTLANVVGYKVKITNIIGQEVYSNVIDKTKLEVSKTWQGEGIYFVKVYDDSNNLLTTRKLILQ